MNDMNKRTFLSLLLCVCSLSFLHAERVDMQQAGADIQGRKLNTALINSTIDRLNANGGGTLFFPAGTYLTGSIHMKSNITLELEAGATLKFSENFDDFLPYVEVRHEGIMMKSFQPLIYAVDAENITIKGEGTLDGNASYENWWKGEGREKIGGAFRPRMIFLNHCENVTVQGLTVQNSPAWNLHPYFSNHTRWIDLKVLNPKQSPNTDGMDPESVDGLEVVGVYFSLGDDCIAMKSGKFYMGHKYKVSSRNVDIRQCYMRHGHGAVTLGSEIAAGVRHLSCKKCIFEDTDRGLRVKTRRGRGEDSVVEDILFEDIKMDGVLTPFVVNSYYWCCDPDGHSTYVSTKEPLPVDERTPRIKELAFRNIEAHNCHVAGTFIYGLPEAKIEKVTMENIEIDFAENPTPEYPAMMAEVEPCTNRGVFINNVKELTLKNVKVHGTAGEPFEIENVDCVEKE